MRANQLRRINVVNSLITCFLFFWSTQNPIKMRTQALNPIINSKFFVFIYPHFVIAQHSQRVLPTQESLYTIEKNHAYAEKPKLPGR
jgi:hypothetical protein